METTDPGFQAYCEDIRSKQPSFRGDGHSPRLSGLADLSGVRLCDACEGSPVHPNNPCVLCGTKAKGRDTLPTDPTERKKVPITTGVLDYFPLAIAEVARVSMVANEQHNPGQPMHWAKGKSTDHADCLARHLIERGHIDTDGMRHSAKVAWRALALLQIELEVAK
jgi:hypothetical protein